MRNFDMVTSFVVGTSIVPASVTGTGTTTGSAVNFQQCDPELAVIADVGALTGTSVLTVTLTQCATVGGTYTAISGFSLVASVTSVVAVGMCISRQANYVKAVGVLSGNAGSPVGVFGVILASQLKIF